MLLYVGKVQVTVLLLPYRFQNRRNYRNVRHIHSTHAFTCSGFTVIINMLDSKDQQTLQKHYLPFVYIFFALDLFYTNTQVTTRKYSTVTCNTKLRKILKIGAFTQNTNIVINHLDFHMKACNLYRLIIDSSIIMVMRNTLKYYTQKNTC